MARLLRFFAVAALFAASARAQVLPGLQADASDAPQWLASGDLNGDGFVDLVTGGHGLAVLLQAPGGGLLPSVLYTVAGNKATDVTLGYLDADGAPDVVYVAGGSVSTRLGDGQGGFGPAFSISVSGDLRAIGLADFDGDGAVDVAVASANLDSVTILHGDGAGGLLPPGPLDTLHTADQPTGLAAGDLDANGHPDVVTMDKQSAKVSRFMNSGAGSFQTMPLLSTPLQDENVLIGDLDEDDDADLVVWGTGVAQLLSQGGTVFAPFQQIFSFGSELRFLDVDGNGYGDLVGLLGTTGYLRALLGAEGPGFVPGVEVPAGFSPWGLAVLDADGDGLLDAAVGSDEGHRVLILPGLGLGEFQAYALTKLIDRPTAFAVSDLNGDAAAEAAVANPVGFFASGGVTVLLNDGQGKFPTAVKKSLGSTLDVAAGDVDGDGDRDLVSVREDEGIDVELGNGTGLFSTSTFYPVLPQPLSLALGDLDGDAVDDVLVKFVLADGSGGRVAVLLADGAGGLLPPTSIVVGKSSPVALGDVDLNGTLDMVLVSETAGARVYLGSGTGTFGAPVTSPAPSGTSNLVVGDAGHDGLPDLVLVRKEAGTGYVSVLPGTGTGALLPWFDLATGESPRGVALGDLDADGFTDIVAATGLAAFLHLADGAGGFLPPTAHIASSGPIDVAIADLDGDDRLDVLVLNDNTVGDSEFGELTLLRNLGPEEPWTALGQGKAGVAGIPMLVGHGSLLAGDEIALQLAGAAPSSAATLVIGSAPLFAPFKGGVLVPMPNFVFPGLSTEADGSLLLAADWPSGIPSGLQTWYQFWVADVGGYAASNGVTAVAP